MKILFLPYYFFPPEVSSSATHTDDCYRRGDDWEQEVRTNNSVLPALQSHHSNVIHTKRKDVNKVAKLLAYTTAAERFQRNVIAYCGTPGRVRSIHNGVDLKIFELRVKDNEFAPRSGVECSRLKLVKKTFERTYIAT